MLQKLNFLTILSALAMFFLPWLDIRCSGASQATQTGIQAILGTATPSQEAAVKPTIKIRLDGKSGSESESGIGTGSESLGHAHLVGIALVDIAAALTLSLIAIRRNSGVCTQITGLLTALALLLLVVQFKQEFPAKAGVQQSIARAAGERTGYDPSAGFDPGLASAVAMTNLEVRPLPAFYATLGLLAFPTLVLLNSLLDRIRKRAPGA